MRWAPLLLAAIAASAPGQRRPQSFPVQAPATTTEKTFSVGAATVLKVDNVEGPIRVYGDGGGDIRLLAREIISAQNDASLARAQRDVHLDLTRQGDAITAYVDGPFRCQSSDAPCGAWRDDDGTRHWSDPGYRARFEFEVHVPAAARLDLATVNGGDINVTAVRGDFQIRNVNGGIDLEQVAGSGQASTVNGPVTAVFAGNPARDSVFGSLNGDVRLYLRSGLNAELQYKTFNGAVYTDFDAVPLPAPLATSDLEGGKRVYRAGVYTRARVGAGGPVLRLDGFNGNIYLHRGAPRN